MKAFPSRKKYATTIFSRLNNISKIPNNARVLDIGSPAGGFLVACNQMGYRCVGVEPWEEARLNAKKLAEHLGTSIHIVDGLSESLPFADNTFDVVHASSVMEHVKDIEKAFSEINRVLKSGGVFWFSAASSMCPRQNEIQVFPFFGWYPQSLKHRIMNWAKNHKPYLVGYSDTPAMNWFTPSKARKLLKRYGFKEVYDRWDLRLENEGGRLYRCVLRIIRLNRYSKTIADVIVPDCSYAAIKAK